MLRIIRFVLNNLLNECENDLLFLKNRLEQEDKSKPETERNELNLIERLKFVVYDFKKITYSNAFEILKVVQIKEEI